MQTLQRYREISRTIKVRVRVSVQTLTLTLLLPSTTPHFSGVGRYTSILTVYNIFQSDEAKLALRCFI